MMHHQDKRVYTWQYSCPLSTVHVKDLDPDPKKLESPWNHLRMCRTFNYIAPKPSFVSKGSANATKPLLKCIIFLRKTMAAYPTILVIGNFEFVSKGTANVLHLLLNVTNYHMDHERDLMHYVLTINCSSTMSMNRKFNLWPTVPPMAHN
jgi:hypothetical protein